MALNKQRSEQFISTFDQRQSAGQVVDRDEAIVEITGMLRTINQLFEFSDFEIDDDEQLQQMFIRQYQDLAETRTGLVNLRNKLVESNKKRISNDQKAEMMALLKKLLKQSDTLHENVLNPLVRADKQTYEQYSASIEEV